MESIKHRTLHVDTMSCEGCEGTVTEELSNLKGVCDVKADRSSGTVQVVYDLMHVKLKDIETALKKAGYPVHDSFVSRLKNRFINFSEENEKNNLTTPPRPCCSQFIKDDAK